MIVAMGTYLRMVTLRFVIGFNSRTTYSFRANPKDSLATNDKWQVVSGIRWTVAVKFYYVGIGKEQVKPRH
jgi:hypothetical protein